MSRLSVHLRSIVPNKKNEASPSLVGLASRERLKHLPPNVRVLNGNQDREEREVKQ